MGAGRRGWSALEAGAGGRGGWDLWGARGRNLGVLEGGVGVPRSSVARPARPAPSRRSRLHGRGRVGEGLVSEAGSRPGTL